MNDEMLTRHPDIALPKEMMLRLEAEAAQQKRSLTKHVVWIVERHLAEQLRLGLLPEVPEEALVDPEPSEAQHGQSEQPPGPPTEPPAAPPEGTPINVN